MTKTLDISTLPQLAEALKEIGEDEAIVLTENGRKIGVVKPEEENTTEKPKERVFGLGAGEGYYMAADFDAELSDSFWLGEE